MTAPPPLTPLSSTIERLGLWALRKLPPEPAHKASLAALRVGLAPRQKTIASAPLRCRIAGLELPNPVGLAAGYDKNAVAISPLLRAGFGFVELGAVTPRPQPGNPKPRLFRLPAQGAVINRFGFNNDGAEVVAKRLAARRPGGVIGLNLGANKDSEDRTKDYVSVLRCCGPFVDFATVNVSSPNTAGLRALQEGDTLLALLRNVMTTRETLPNRPKIFLKIAPDLTIPDLDDICNAALTAGIDAIIATNTTVERGGCNGPHCTQKGGLSGGPLFAPSTRILALLAQRLAGRLPLIGVGGIASADDAYAKIKAGASAIQLYTALVYQGLSLIGDINRGLEGLLAQDGLPSLGAAVGVEKDMYS